jgi:hypothetical protein
VKRARRRQILRGQAHLGEIRAGPRPQLDERSVDLGMKLNAARNAAISLGIQSGSLAFAE